jgi:ABC-type Zn uptake system ZnuABC Zn-binding protein ZnuA
MKHAAALSLLFLIGACTSGGPRTLQSGEKLIVMSSTFHLAALAMAVCGEDASVELLPAEGADPHSFEATAADRARLEKAQVLLINGLALETFDAPKLSASARVTLVDCSTGVAEKFLLEGEEAEHEGHDHGHDHGHEAHDPHVWLSTEGAAMQAKAIAQACAKLDAAHADGYHKRADELAARLKKLREEYAGKIDALANKAFVTDHDAFGYFAREFKLKNVGHIRKLPGKEPTVEERSALEKLIKETGAKAIFIEPGHDKAAAEAVAKSVGVKLAQLDPMEVGKPTRTSYEETMRKNLEAVLEALK